MSYKIGSFNICNLNLRDNKEVSRSFEMIARIILEEKFDIIAMQEVLSEMAIREILKYMTGRNAEWKYKWLQPKSKASANGDKRGEGYAYIWNARKIDLVKTEVSKEVGSEMFFYEREAEPVIWRQYKKNGRAIEREPYYARFTPIGKPGGSFFELRLINTHIIFGSNVTERLDEYKKLLDSVYVNIANRRYGNNMPAYTVMLGDYNLTSVQINRRDGLRYFIESIYVGSSDQKEEREIITIQDKPTTLNRTQKEDGTYISTGYTENDYDHFSLTRELEEKVVKNADRVDAVNIYYDGDDGFEVYRKQVSDHVPIMLDIDLRKHRG